MTTSASDSGPSRPPFPPAADELPNLSQPQRPFLRLSLPATPSAARHSSTAASPTHLPSDNPSLAGAAAPPRASSHSRSQSMSEAHPPSPPLHGTAHPDLVRRHHTLSTSASSRLIRQERRSARVALQGVGLSAEDVKYYVGSSPVDGRSGWSDTGHDASLGGGGGSHGLHLSPSSSTFDSSPVPPARRSSFQVLRGARGEATLTERRQSANFEDLSRTTPPRPGQERRTSLQPFLEGELAMESEADTIGREQYASRSYTSRYSPPASAFPRSGSPYSFQQTIGSVVSPGGAGPWQADEEERAAVRRRQSLNNFRAEELASSVRSEGWMGDERLGSEDLVGSGSFGHSRSGTSPALSITTNIARPSLSHSNSIISPGGSRTLGHSKSLSSHTAPGGPLSPVGGFPRSPWSPTVEETKQLGMGGEPVRGGNGGRLGEGVSRLSVDMSALALATDVVDDGRSEVGFTRDTVVPPKRRLPPLMTNPDVLASLGQPSQPIGAAPSSFLSRQGPASAAAYVLPLGHSHLPFSSKPRPESYSNAYSPQPLPSTSGVQTRGNLTAAPGAGGSDWLRQKELLIGATSFPSTLPRANPPSAHDWDNGEGVDHFAVDLAMHQQQQIQLLQLQMNHAMQAMDLMKAQGVPSPQYPEVRSASVEVGAVPVVHEVEEAPVDLAALIAEKGYNPTSFNLRPVNARFFVIKSYTEEDVHKSLKHEIWASTDLGNKRLDRAFRESAEKGPIYLFFSVNASGHFAGMAQMLTPVDYATSSTVWASDKWKGVLKLKWIYIKDVPLASLRHIRLSNTPENKPVTSSRDTQEVPYEAGCEVLRILSSYQSRTSLLEVSNRQEGLQQRASTPSHYAVRPTSAPPTQYQYQQQQPMLYPQQQQQLLHHHQQQQLIHQSQQLQQHQQQQQQQHQQAMFNQFQPPQGGRRYGPSGGGLMRAQDGGVF